MSDETLVEMATELVLSALATGHPASPDDLEAAVTAENPALGREIVGLAALRLIRDGKIFLTQDYLFAVRRAEVLSA